MIDNKELRQDKEAYEALLCERKRQEENIELIASENYVSNAVREANGSIFTNKYAEGYPGKRYYGGCQYIDKGERLAINRAKELFHCAYANVQPHSGTQANREAYSALLNSGDKILGMALDAGGHLSHGYRFNFSGKEYTSFSYGVNEKTGLIDYDEVRRIAKEVSPKLIICGASAYPRFIDFKEFRAIADEVNALLLVDRAHIAGLVATGDHPSPLPYADVITSTTHKTLRGPRGGLILSKDAELGRKIDKAVFPRRQGGPLENTILAKAVCFGEDLKPEFKEYTHQILKNAKALASSLKREGFSLITGGTDNHLILVDVRGTCHITGLKAQRLLEEVNITTNKNAIPGDKEKPAYASGLRLGTPARTTRGYKEDDFDKVGHLIGLILKNPDSVSIQDQVKKEVADLNKRYPLPYEEE